MSDPKTREEVFKIVETAIINLVGFQPTPVTEETNLDDDLFFDDLDDVELFIELENSFPDVELDEGKLTEAETVKEIVDYLMAVA